MPGTSIVASIVPLKERLAFLPYYLGTQMTRFENAVYDWMKTLDSEYQGGYWNFLTLSNGGFYVAPASSQVIQPLLHSPNGSMHYVSSDAAGIVATMFALSTVMEDGEDAIVEHYYQLRDFVAEHAERSKIFALID